MFPLQLEDAVRSATGRLPVGRQREAREKGARAVARPWAHPDWRPTFSRDVRSRANLRSPARSAVRGYPVSIKAEPIEET